MNLSGELIARVSFYLNRTWETRLLCI